MWPLMKASLSYNRAGLLGLYLAAIVVWSIYLIDPAGMLMLFGVPGLFLMLALFTRSTKEKHERLWASLPVSALQRGAAGPILFAALLHLGMLSLWPLQFLMDDSRRANEFITLAAVIALNGIVICVFILILMRYDLQGRGERFRKRLVNIALLAALGMPLLFRFMAELAPESFARAHDLVFFSPMFAMATNLLGLGLISTRIKVYGRRASYLE